jgi:hypothetical protein
MELISRAMNDDIQNLLIEFFNETNNEVVKTYAEQQRKL